MRATGISHFHAVPDVWSLFMMSGRVIWPSCFPSHGVLGSNVHVTKGSPLNSKTKSMVLHVLNA